MDFDAIILEIEDYLTSIRNDLTIRYNGTDVTFTYGKYTDRAGMIDSVHVFNNAIGFSILPYSKVKGPTFLDSVYVPYKFIKFKE